MIKKTYPLKLSINLFFILILGLTTLIFGISYIKSSSIFIINKYNSIFQAIFTVIMSVITTATIIFSFTKNKFLYKLSFATIIFLLIMALGFYLLKKSSFFDKVDSVEDLKIFINGFGFYADLAFILVQFLQVALLPIPAVITIGAGVLIFSPLKTIILSSIGIIFGSITAFFIGRVLGNKVVSWLVGKEKLEKWVKTLKGKDKIILTTAFLLPFFPDDVLCFVAGISSISSQFFIIMTVITRLITISFTTFSLNNSFIPYNTWWGIVIWLIIFAITIYLVIFVTKNGKKIEKTFNKFLKNKRKKDEKKHNSL